MLRVSISHLHRGARHTHQDARSALLSVMSVRSVANGGIGAVVPITVAVSDPVASRFYAALCQTGRFPLFRVWLMAAVGR
jgi:hypothetical protein